VSIHNSNTTGLGNTVNTRTFFPFKKCSLLYAFIVYKLNGACAGIMLKNLKFILISNKGRLNCSSIKYSISH
jgi:hypothetical protein